MWVCMIKLIAIFVLNLAQFFCSTLVHMEPSKTMTLQRYFSVKSNQKIICLYFCNICRIAITFVEYNGFIFPHVIWNSVKQYDIKYHRLEAWM